MLLVVSSIEVVNSKEGQTFLLQAENNTTANRIRIIFFILDNFSVQYWYFLMSKIKQSILKFTDFYRKVAKLMDTIQKISVFKNTCSTDLTRI